jgi:hypothetical protein
MGLQKAGCKKEGHCYSKREEAMLPAPCFLQPIVWTFFLKFQTLKKYQADLIN